MEVDPNQCGVEDVHEDGNTYFCILDLGHTGPHQYIYPDTEEVPMTPM